MPAANMVTNEHLTELIDNKQALAKSAPVLKVYQAGLWYSEN